MTNGSYAPEELSTGGHYSPGVVAGGFVFTAGQVPRDAHRKIIGDTIETQTKAALENLRIVLEVGGARLEHVVQVRVHLSDIALAPGFNRIYEAVFGSHKPARTTVGSQLNGVMVEIDAIAYIGSDR